MKLRRVAFKNFGPFGEKILDFPADGPSLHVIYGPNEAGKSSALRGLGYFLFGFPVQNEDNFIHDYNKFRIRVELARADGTVLELTRRKGRQPTLRSDDDQAPVHESVLQNAIGNLTSDQFEMLFGLDSIRLANGGRTIVAGEGDLGAALFSAGAGMRDLERLKKGIDDQMNALFRPQGQSQRVAAALQAHRECGERERGFILPVETYAAKVEEHRCAREHATDIDRQRREVQIEVQKLVRYRTALPTIGQLHTARERLRAVQSARMLPDDFAEGYRRLNEQLVAGRNSCERLGADIAGLQSQLAEVLLPSALLEEQDTIDRLRTDVAGFGELRRQYITDDTRMRENRDNARTIFVELTRSTSLEDAERYRSTDATIARIRSLSGEKLAIDTTLRNSRDRLGELINQRNNAHDQLQNAPEPENPTTKRRLVREVGAERGLEAQWRELRLTCDTELTAIRNELAALHPSVPVALERVSLLPVVAHSEITNHRRALETLKSSFQTAERDLLNARRDLTEIQSRIESFQQQEPVPSEHDLVAARLDRNQGIADIRAQLEGREASASLAGFIVRHAPGRPLIDAVEASVRDCDGIADRLRWEADRVARWRELNAQHTANAGRLELLEEESNRRREQLAQAQTTWQTAWGPTGIAPGSPETMIEWLARLSRIRERYEAWLGRIAQRDLSKERLTELRDALQNSFPQTRAALTLANAIDTADGLVAAMEATVLAVGAQRTELTRLEREAEAAWATLSGAEAAQNEWCDSWAAVIQPLRLPADASVETVERYLDRIDTMQQHLSAMRIKAAAIRGFESRRDLLLERLNSLRRRMEPSCRESTVESLESDYVELDSRLREAREGQAQGTRISEQLRAKETDHRLASDELQAIEATLSSQAALAGVASLSDIPDAIERSRSKSQAERDVRDSERTLAEQAQGEDAEQFEAAALGHRAGIEHRIEELNARIHSLNDQAAVAQRDASNAHGQLEAWRAASEEAAAARQEQEFHARTIADCVEEYLSLHLAQQILALAVEQYRAQNQDNLLSRAGSYFKELTCADFAGLATETGNTLIGLRADSSRDDARVPVAGLSQGTLDQLFLALRLAGIEKHLAEREPMPIIIDDVLVNFDDKRARATLACLGTLSKKAQVLVFTHHRHIIELARAIVPAHQLSVHDF